MTLKIYSFVIETLRLLAPVMQEIARRDADLARQMRRAASTIALNTRKGRGTTAGIGANDFERLLGRRKRRGRVSKWQLRSITWLLIRR